MAKKKATKATTKPSKAPTGEPKPTPEVWTLERLQREKPRMRELGPKRKALLDLAIASVEPDHPLAVVARAIEAADRAQDEAAMMRLLRGEREHARPEGSAGDDDYRPARSFPKGMADKLRMAARPDRKTMRVATRKIDGVVCYSVADARRWWPDDVPEE